MLHAFVAAVLVLGLPVVVLGAALAALCGSDDGAAALGPVAALSLCVLGLACASSLGLGGWWLTAVPIALGVVGAVWLVRSERSAAPLLLPGLAALAVVGIMALPFRTADGVGVLGYNVANDAPLHAIEAQHLVDGGAAPVPGSSFAGVIERNFSGIGYPHGSHALLAAVAPAGGGVLASYDAVLAVLVAFAAFPAFWLLRRCAVEPRLAAAGAALAAGGYLQLGFFEQGFLPQLAATAFVLASIGLGYEAAVDRRLGTAALTGLAVGGAVAVYSLNVVVYIAPALALVSVGAVAFARDRLARLGRLVMQALVLAAAALVALGPQLGGTWHFLRASRGVVDQSGTAIANGNLSSAVDLRTVLGAWIGPDLRVPYQQIRPTQAALAAAAILVAIAIIAALWRRRPALLVMLVSCGFAALVISERSGIYYQAKSYQVLAVPVACAVVAGAAALVEGRTGTMRIAATVVATCLLGGWSVAVLRSLDSEARNAAITPPELLDLQALGRTLPGLGLALLPDAWAKFALPGASVPDDAGSGGVFASSIVPGRSEDGWYDYDSFDPSVARDARWIVEYRVGGVSVPPPPYQLRRGRGPYRLWLRSPLSKAAPRRTPLEPVGQLGGRALAPGKAFALPVPAAGLYRLGAEPLDSVFTRPATWKLAGTAWGTWTANPVYVVAQGVGAPAEHPFSVSDPGLYLVLLRGLPAANMAVAIDGRRLSPPRPVGLDGRQLLGPIALTPGRHRLQLIAGDGTVSYIRALAIQREGLPVLGPLCIRKHRYSASAAQPLRLRLRPGDRVSNCGSNPLRLDWLERLSG